MGRPLGLIGATRRRRPREPNSHRSATHCLSRARRPRTCFAWRGCCGRESVEVRRYRQAIPARKGVPVPWQGVIAGSANFTCGGLVHNRELDDRPVSAQRGRQAEAWFDELWDEGEDYRERLIEIITAREATAWTPHDVYLRALLELYQRRVGLLQEEEDEEGYTPGSARRCDTDRLSAPRFPPCTEHHRALRRRIDRRRCRAWQVVRRVRAARPLR